MHVIVFVAALCAQVDVKPRVVGEQLTLPNATSGANAGRINDAIALFDLTGLSELTFEVTRNDEKLLNITLNGESCGAYCESFTRELTFDQKTGRLVALNDVLTTKGIAAAAKAMKAERRRRFSEQVQQYTKARTAKGLSADDKTDMDDRIALNRACITEDKDRTFDADSLRASFREHITLTSGRCSNHASRALDDVGDVSIDAKDGFELTSYGRWLYDGGPDVSAPISMFGQVLHGKVGNAAVTMLLAKPYSDGSLGGRYFYDKHRKPIELSGQRDGTNVSLNEETGAFALTVNGAIMKGTWKGGERSLPVELGQ